MSRWLRVLLPALALLCVPAGLAWGDACATNLSNVSGSAQVSMIELSPNNIGGNAPHFNASHATSAGNDWNNSCSSNQNPSFSTTGGAFNVNVNYIAGNSQAGSLGCAAQGGIYTCGCTRTSTDGSGRIIGATVYIYQRNSDGSSCSSGYEDILRHELGHVLGLGDVSGCSNRIMGNPAAAINSADCDAVDQNFFTLAEQSSLPDGHPCSRPPV